MITLNGMSSKKILKWTICACNFHIAAPFCWVIWKMRVKSPDMPLSITWASSIADTERHTTEAGKFYTPINLLKNSGIELLSVGVHARLEL